MKITLETETIEVPNEVGEAVFEEQKENVQQLMTSYIHLNGWIYNLKIPFKYVEAKDS